MNSKTTSSLKVLLVGIAALTLAQPAKAQNAGPPVGTEPKPYVEERPRGVGTDPFDDDQWHFQVGIPFWMTSVSGDIFTPADRAIPVSASFSQAISHLTFGLMGHAEAKRNRIGFGLDLFYVNLSDTLDVDKADASLKSLTLGTKQVFGELFTFYRAIEQGNRQNPGYVDFILGTRYYWTQSQINARENSMGWLDLMLGFRGQLAFGEHFNIRPRADFAFFGSEFTWNLIGELGWTFSEHWFASLGYRAMDIERQNNEKNSSWNVNYHGPQINVVFNW